MSDLSSNPAPPATSCETENLTVLHVSLTTTGKTYKSHCKLKEEAEEKDLRSQTNHIQCTGASFSALSSQKCQMPGLLTTNPFYSTVKYLLGNGAVGKSTCHVST